MIFEITIDDALLDSVKQKDLTHRDFTVSEMNDNETKYIFWLLSMKDEKYEFDKTSEEDYEYKNKYYDLNVIFNEALHMKRFGTPRQADKDEYNIIVYCDIKEDLVLYIGHVFYTITAQNGIPYGLDKNGRWLRTDGKQKVLFFISIYKSIINKCTTCNRETTFSTKMLSYLEDKGLQNNCVCLYTEPIGKMIEILEQNGFLYGRVKPLIKNKSLQVLGGKTKNKKIKNKGKKIKKNKTRKSKK